MNKVNEKSCEFQGIWTKASYINHCCTNNSKQRYAQIALEDIEDTIEDMGGADKVYDVLVAFHAALSIGQSEARIGPINDGTKGMIEQAPEGPELKRSIMESTFDLACAG